MDSSKISSLIEDYIYFLDYDEWVKYLASDLMILNDTVCQAIDQPMLSKQFLLSPILNTILKKELNEKLRNCFGIDEQILQRIAKKALLIGKIEKELFRNSRN